MSKRPLKGIEGTVLEQRPSMPRRHHPSLTRSVLSVTLARTLSIVLGLGREVLASAYYGTSGSFSAFAIAFQIPTTAQGLIGQGALSAALLPVLVRQEEDGEKEAMIALVSRLLMLITTALALIALGFVVLAPRLLPAILGDGFSPATQELTVSMSQLLFPIVILLGAQSIAVAVLNSKGRFTLAAYTPAVWNFVVVASLVFFRPLFPSEDAIYAYAVAVLAGGLAQLLWLIPGLTTFSLRAALRRAPDRKVMRRLLIRIAPIALVAGAWQGDFIINLVVGSMVSDAAPRALQAAQRLSMVGFGLVSLAISTVAYPTFRRQVLRGETSALAALVSRTMRANLVMLIAIAALVIAVATPFTTVMYERGEFGPRSTELVSTALIWIIVGLPAGGMWDLLTKVCFAADRYWQPATLAALALGLNLFLSLLLQGPLGIAGIALASSVSFTVVAILLAGFVRRRVVPYAVGEIVRSASALILVATAAAAGAAGLVHLVQAAIGADFASNLLALFTTAAIGGGLYAAGVRLLAPRDAALLLDQVKQVVPRLRPADRSPKSE